MTSIEGKSLLIVRVVHWQGPFHLKSKGLSDGVYIRLGSTNRVAGPELLEELQRSTSKISFDQLPCPNVDVTGSIVDAMTEVPKFIKRNTRLAANIEKIHRRDIPEYSLVAIREVLTKRGRS